ncbi:hypothetical protein ACE3KB_08325 [Enterobacter hormaechei subsp. oharae]
MQKQTFSAEALGNEYATGVSRPAVLTTKTFLPHQRVTTEGKAMNYYLTTTNQGSDLVIVYARSKFVVKALLNDDCETIDKISATEAKKLINKGVRFIK